MSRPPRSAVRNAADREQVKRADRNQQRVVEQFLDCLRAVMDTRDGRLVFWKYLGKFGVYEDIYSDSPQRMAYDAGRRRAGLELLADLLAAGEDNFQKMEREMRAQDDAEAATEQAEQQAQTDMELQ